MELEYILDIIQEACQISWSYILDSETRIYFLYLFSSCLLAFYVFRRSSVKTNFLKYVFNKRIWASRSAMMDYMLFLFNNIIKVALIGPYLIVGLYIAFYINEYLLQLFGIPSRTLTMTQTVIFYTISLSLINDFLSFVVHYLMHRIPFLWEFHKIHHSATSLNPMTQYRIHPLELVINNVRSIITFGFVTGIFDYLSNHTLDKILFIGVNIFSFLFLFFGANLRHSHVKLTYPSFLEKLLISPYQHQIHHSQKESHFDKNLGSKLAIWDWLFGTLILSKSAKRISFGIGKESKNYHSFWNVLFMPLKNLFSLKKKDV